MLNVREYTRFRDMTNPIKYFMENDGLHGLGQVSLNVLSHYHCGGGCEICYVKDYWQPIKALLKNSETISPDSVNIAFKKVHKLFDHVEVFDDPILLNKFFPSIYQEFVKWSVHMIAPSVTDNNVLRFARDIDLIEYRDMYQISLTDTYLLKHQAKLMKALSVIVNKYGKVNVIRIITEHPELQTDLRMPDAVAELKQFAECVNTVDNINTDNRISLKTEEGQPVFNGVDDNIYTENDKLYLVLNQGVFTNQGRYYFTLEDLIRPDPANAFSTTDCNPERFLSDYLSGKIERYKQYTEEIKNHDSVYYRYFKTISDKVKVDADYNFIPFFMINWNFKVFTALLESGWVKIPQGIIKSGSESLRPLIIT